MRCYVLCISKSSEKNDSEKNDRGVSAIHTTAERTPGNQAYISTGYSI